MSQEPSAASMWHGRSRVARDPRGRPGAAPSSAPRPRVPATAITTDAVSPLRTAITTDAVSPHHTPTSARTPLRALALAPLLLLPACEELPRTYSSAGPAQLLFADRFEASELGPAWKSTGPGARIEGGELVVEGLRNHPLWLTLPLPDNVRVEFDAVAATDEGDIKVELAGDGKSFARSASYKATGYVIIFGGWNNTTSAIVRRDEHGGDRRTTQSLKVEARKRYHFAITRRDGEILWELDGQEALRYDDPEPLTGPAQRHFAFGGWEARVAFDNLEVFAL